MRLPRLSLLIVPLVACGIWTAPASALTFGADLANLPATNTVPCSQAPNYYTPAAGSCMYSYFQLGSSTNTLEPPIGGTVSQIRVKVGAVTGPMRVNVIRFLFRQTGDAAHPQTAGPFLEAYGPQFTPAANAITPVNTNLAMREDNTPPVNDTNTVQVIDGLALEVLVPNVPIPLFNSPNSLTQAIYPGPTASNTPAPSPNALPNYTTQNIGVLMNADIGTATGTGGGQGPAGSAPGTVFAPALGFRTKTANVRRGVASLPLICGRVDCSGVVDLLGTVKAAAAAKPRTKTRTVSYGSARFTVKAGRKTTLKVKLTRAGRALLTRRRKAKVTARIRYSKGKAKTSRTTITLQR